ncbi:hypothetical protein GDO86_016412 [Hymenochirus boettgeri]|uniref:Olfactory receptor n=1 Tax=Hymenochirus boettgeri TaxID=247094 RepID=A0A8T2JZK1_9PIPI|nr:hypothetical protein GDO86_016412 [Hymenochirus boettgeri]
MGKNNQTRENLITLMGFQMFLDFRIFFFILIFFLYVLTISVNVVISALVYSSSNLHHPMFFFLSHLSVCDITLTTSIVPLMLPGVLTGSVTISLPVCIIQLQLFCTSLTSECLLLVVMSFDRYLAICNPLRYTSIMSRRLCFHLVFLCWVLGFTAMFSLIICLSRLEFCGTDIDHFICDFLPVLHLSCSDNTAVKLHQLLISIITGLFTSVSLIITYMYIFRAIFKIPYISGRQKAFSTCSSHMAVVFTFLGSLFGIYILPSTGKTLTANKFLSLLYSIGTPLFNPIIYCLRNMEIREAFKKTYTNGAPEKRPKLREV